MYKPPPNRQTSVGEGAIRIHAESTFPLKPGILVKDRSFLVKRKNGFTRNHPLDRKPWKSKEKSMFSKSTFTFYQNDRFFTKILGFKGKGS